MRCLDPRSYVASQRLAGRLLEGGSIGVVYPSVRRSRGTNLACFRPAVVGNVRRGNSWNFTLVGHGKASSRTREPLQKADPLECPRCRGPMRLIALIDDPSLIRRVLEHLGCWAPKPASRGPYRRRRLRFHGRISAERQGNNMAAKLLQQNPYLRDPKTREESIRVAVASSSAVEGIRKPFAVPKNPITPPARKAAKSAR